MICVVEGAVGAGKTYYCVKMLAEHLKHGGIVATNLTLDLHALRRLTGRRLSSGQFLQIDATSDPRTIPRGDLRGHGSRRVLVILDEALNWFASSSSKDDPRRASWGEWLRQSDKLGQTVVFVAQRFDRAAKWLRELAQLCYSVRNLGQLRLFGIPWGRVFGLKHLSVAVKYDLTINGRVGSDWYILRPEVWECYDTSVLYGFAASENAYARSTGLWPAVRHPVYAFVLLGAFALWGVLRFAWSSVFACLPLVGMGGRGTPHRTA